MIKYVLESTPKSIIIKSITNKQISCYFCILGYYIIGSYNMFKKSAKFIQQNLFTSGISVFSVIISVI